MGNTLYALGRLGIYYESLTDRMQIAIEVSIRKSFDRMKRKDVLQTVHGLAMMGFQWGALTLRTRECIAIAIFKQVNQWTDDAPTALRDVALLLYSLQSMGVQWDELPSGVRSACFVGIQSTFDFEKTFDHGHRRHLYGAAMRDIRKSRGSTMKKTTSKQTDDEFVEMMISTGQSTATIVYSLAKMNASVEDFPKETLDSLLFSVKVFIGYYSPQGLAMIFYGLGNLNVRWESFSPSFAQLLLDAIVSLELAGLPLSQAILGMSLLRIRWIDLPLRVQLHLKSQLEIRATKSSPQVFAVLLRGLAGMGMTVNRNVDDGVRRVILDIFNEHKVSFSNSELTLSLRSLGSLHFRRWDLGNLEELGYRVKQLDLKSLVYFLQSLVDLEYGWNDIHEFTRAAIFENLVKNEELIHAHDMVNIYHNLGKLSLSFVVLKHHQKEILIALLRNQPHAMEPYQITLYLVGLSYMQVPWTLLPETIKAVVESHIFNCASRFDTRTVLTVLSAISRLRCDLVGIWQVLVIRLDQLRASLSQDDIYSALLSLNRLQIELESLSDIISYLTDRLFVKDVLLPVDGITVEGFRVTNIPLHKKLSVVTEYTVDRKEVKDAIDHYFQDSNQLNAADVLPVLKILTHLKVQASQLGTTAQKHILDLLNKNAAMDECQSLPLEPVVLIKGLGFDLRSVPSYVLEYCLLSLFSKSYDVVDIEDVFDTADINFSSLSPLLKRTVVRYLIRMIHRSSDTISSIPIIASILQKIGANWQTLPTRPRNDLALTLSAFFDGSLSHSAVIIRFLISVEAKWRMLPKDIRYQIVEYLNNCDSSTYKCKVLREIEGLQEWYQNSRHSTLR